MCGGPITVATARRHFHPHHRALQHQDPVLGLQAIKTPWLCARRNLGLMPYAGIRKGLLPGRASVDPNSPLNGRDYTRSVGISQERTRNKLPFGCTRAPPKPAPNSYRWRRGSIPTRLGAFPPGRSSSFPRDVPRKPCQDGAPPSQVSDPSERFACRVCRSPEHIRSGKDEQSRERWIAAGKPPSSGGSTIRATSSTRRPKPPAGASAQSRTDVARGHPLAERFDEECGSQTRVRSRRLA
jgi:hypothetical protein